MARGDLVDWHIWGAFAATALFESLSPGPTIALVLDRRVTHGSASALKAVAGITVANVIWVAVAFAVTYWKVTGLGSFVGEVVNALAVPVLMYLACERILTASIAFIVKRPDGVQQTSKSGDFWTAFVAHLLNPLSPAFYLAAFAVTISGRPLNEAALFGAIPIVMDILVFGFLATFRPPLTAEQFPEGLLQLLSGVGLFVIIAWTLKGVPAGAASGSVGTAFVLGALLAAALRVALSLAKSFKTTGGRGLWRAVAMWESWFKVAAVVGAIVSLSVVVADASRLDRIRIVSVVAAVIAAALSFAKAYGDLQEELSPAKSPLLLTPGAWQVHPLKVGASTFGFLWAIYMLLALTGFRL